VRFLAARRGYSEYICKNCGHAFLHSR
jgi:hypothetical protein